MGGPIAERAEITDKNPPQIVRYDRWGHEVNEVVIAESAKATPWNVLWLSFSTITFHGLPRPVRPPVSSSSLGGVSVVTQIAYAA